MIISPGSIQREELRFAFSCWNSRFEWKLSSDYFRLHDKVDGSISRLVYSAEEFILKFPCAVTIASWTVWAVMQFEEVARIIFQKFIEFQGSEKWQQILVWMDSGRSDHPVLSLVCDLTNRILYLFWLAIWNSHPHYWTVKDVPPYLLWGISSDDFPLRNQLECLTAR